MSTSIGTRIFFQNTLALTLQALQHFLARRKQARLPVGKLLLCNGNPMEPMQSKQHKLCQALHIEKPMRIQKKGTSCVQSNAAAPLPSRNHWRRRRFMMGSDEVAVRPGEGGTAVELVAWALQEEAWLMRDTSFWPSPSP